MFIKHTQLRDRHRESCILAFNIAEFLLGYHLNSSYSTDPGRFQLLYVSNIDAVRLKLLNILVKTLIFQNVWLLCFHHLVSKYWLLLKQQKQDVYV